MSVGSGLRSTHPACRCSEILLPLLVDVSGAVGSAGAVDQRPEHRRQHHHGKEHVHRVAHRLDARCEVHRHHSDGRDEHGHRQQSGEQIRRRRPPESAVAHRRQRGRVPRAAPALAARERSPSNYGRRRRRSGSIRHPSPASSCRDCVPASGVTVGSQAASRGDRCQIRCADSLLRPVPMTHIARSIWRCRPIWTSANCFRRSSTSFTVMLTRERHATGGCPGWAICRWMSL